MITEMTYAQAIRMAMCQEMRRDPNVFLMGEDVGVYQGAFGVTGRMYEEFPGRVIDTPISETGFMGAAIGAAIEGMRPVVEIMFADFLAVCWDMIINQAAKLRFMFGGSLRVPLVVRAASGAGTGAAAQHSQSIEAMLCHAPGLKVVAPSTPADAKGLLVSAIRDNNPVVFFEQKLLYGVTGPVEEAEYTIPLGVADLKRAGDDCTVVTYGRMTPLCLAAADALAERGIEAEVLDLRTLMPLDKSAVLASVRRTHRLLVVHEAVKTGGLGSEIAAIVAESELFRYLDAPIRRLAGADAPVPFSPALEAGVLPDEERIAHAIGKLVAGK